MAVVQCVVCSVPVAKVCVGTKEGSVQCKTVNKRHGKRAKESVEVWWHACVQARRAEKAAGRHAGSIEPAKEGDIGRCKR